MEDEEIKEKLFKLTKGCFEWGKLPADVIALLKKKKYKRMFRIQNSKLDTSKIIIKILMTK